MSRVFSVTLISSVVLLALTSGASAGPPSSLTNRMNRLNSCMSMSSSSHIGSSNCFTGSTASFATPTEAATTDLTTTRVRGADFLPAPLTTVSDPLNPPVQDGSHTIKPPKS
jgi:hypothetical protein